MLGLQQDVEAELGIGSIKRLEILEALGLRLPPSIAQRLKAAMDQVARLKTFAEWAEILSVADSGTMAAASQTRQPALAPAAPPRGMSAERFDCPRSLMRHERKPLTATTALRGTGSVLITEDALGVAVEVERLLRGQGIAAAVLPRRCLADGRLASALDEARAAVGPFRAVLHLAGLEAQAVPSDIAGWRACTEREAKSFLRLLRLLADDLDLDGPKSVSRVISASLLGGYFGRDKLLSPGLPTGGGALGALRSLELEWARLHGKAIDFDLSQPAGEIARVLIRELGAISDGVEVGYPRGERVVFAAHPAPGAPEAVMPLDLPRDAVVLATGGARGITAELLRSVVKPGMTVILVGRSAAEAGESAEPIDPAAFRATLIERDRTARVHRRPADIELAVTAAVHRREAARTIASLRSHGPAVEYHALEVSDADRFARLIADIYARHGRIDLVLHGAGVIEDKHLVDKTDASIDRVFDTKVDSAFTLYRALDPATLKAAVFFTSLSGRFGNRGQVDYAAANEVINRLAWRMAAEWAGVRVLSINWGPWARIGMAVDALGIVGRRLAPIEPEAGCAFFLSELESGNSGEVEILAGDIALSESEQPADIEPDIAGADTAELLEPTGDS